LGVGDAVGRSERVAADDAIGAVEVGIGVTVDAVAGLGSAALRLDLIERLVVTVVARERKARRTRPAAIGAEPEEGDGRRDQRVVVLKFVGLGDAVLGVVA